MTYACTIGGRAVALEWTQETAKRFAFRMGQIGGEPTAKELKNPKTFSTALFKMLWGLLPVQEFQRYADPESLFVDVDHDAEAAAIYDAVRGIYAERIEDIEKKSTLMKSPSPESNSD